MLFRTGTHSWNKVWTKKNVMNKAREERKLEFRTHGRFQVEDKIHEEMVMVTVDWDEKTPSKKVSHEAQIHFTESELEEMLDLLRKRKAKDAEHRELYGL